MIHIMNIKKYYYKSISKSEVNKIRLLFLELNIKFYHKDLESIKEYWKGKYNKTINTYNRLFNAYNTLK